MGDKTENTADFKDSVGARLTKFYEKQDIKRPEFARMMEIPYDRLNSYLQDRAEPPSEFWTKLLEHFPDADIGYILTGIKGMTQVVRTRRVPLLNEIPAGQMNFNFADETWHELIITDNEKDKDLFALRVKGDSMAPDINPGDVIFLSPSRPFVNGKIFAVVTAASEATLKRVFKKPAGYLLVPDNPEYESTMLPEHEVLRLIRVVESKRNFL